MDLLDVLLLVAQAPWWLGWSLMGGGLFTFGLLLGIRLR